MTNTSNIKIHTCPTCGGNLRIDTVRQMYECPFCGLTFDYDYFREDNVLELAEKSMRVGEFGSARRAYEFMLEKEPHNFAALRGLTLIAMNQKHVAALSNMETYRKFNFDGSYKALDKALESADPNDHEYFNLMKDMVENGHEYAKETKEIAQLKENKKNEFIRLNSQIDMRDDVNASSMHRDAVHPVSSVCFLVMGLVIYCLFAWMFFGTAHKNPYEKNTADTTSTTLIFQRADYTIMTRNAVDKNGSSASFNAYQAALDRANQEKAMKEAAEKERLKNYNEWEKKHRVDYVYLSIAIAVPVIIIGGLIANTIKKRRSCDQEIAFINSRIEKMNGDIKLGEDHLAILKKKILDDYARLKKMDPLPVKMEN